MVKIVKCFLFVLVLIAFPCMSAKAKTIGAASCNSGDVQAAINTAASGDTVTIPAGTGTCTWTSGVSISGKGIAIQGSGSGRIIAYDNGTEVETIGTGTKTFTIAGYSPGFSSVSITTGETLRIFENNFRENYMQGTVTSLVGSTLTMKVTGTGVSGSAHRWLISTTPSTIIVANNASTPLFTIAEDTSFHTNWSGIQIAAGTGNSQYITPMFTAGGQAILIHDCWMQSSSGQSLDFIDSETTRGVVWNFSFDGDTQGAQQLITNAAFRVKIDSPAAGQNAWTQTSFWGTNDTTVQNNFYVETSEMRVYPRS